MATRKSPFPEFDPDKIKYPRNIHVACVLVGLSILHVLGAVMLAINIGVLASHPNEPSIAPLWEMALLMSFYIITIPTYLLMALKRDYLDSNFSPLKALPLVFVGLGSIAVAAVEGPSVYKHIWDFVLLTACPITVYFGSVIFGQTPLGSRLFAPFRIGGTPTARRVEKQRDLEMQAMPVGKDKKKPQIVMSPVRPTGDDQ